MRFWLDVQPPGGGANIGEGPIITATRWSHTARLDRAGEIAFEMSARDPRAAYIVAPPKRTVVCRGQLVPDGPVVTLGAGLVEEWTLTPGKDGNTMLAVTGGDLLRELTHNSYGYVALEDGAGGPVANAVAGLVALAPAGWSVDPAGYPTTGVLDYGSFFGELVLGMLGKLAAHNGQHFRLGAGRSVRWLRSGLTSAGVRAVGSGDPLALEADQDVCLIEALQEVSTATELVTRVYPYGTGNGGSRLLLTGHTDRVAPAGYTYDALNNCLIASAQEAALGLQISRHLSWKEISPISNSDADLRAAANVLFDACYNHLRIVSQVQKTYRLSVAGLKRLLYPGETIRVVYQGWADILNQAGNKTGNYHYLDVDQELCILETQNEIGDNGLRTVGLIVSTVDAWPVSAAEVLASEIEAGRLYEAHPQLTLAYSPVGPYTRRMDSTHDAAFTVSLGSEVTFLNYARLRFKTGPLLSSVSSSAVPAGGGGTTPSGGGSTTPSGGGSTTPSGGGSTTPSGGGTTSGGGGYIGSLSIATQSTNRSGGGSGIYGSRTSSDAPANPHSHDVPHDHSIVHNHSVEVPSHTHANPAHVHATPAHVHSTPDHVHSTPDHVHTTPDHTHTINHNYGLYEDNQYPTGISLAIDGVDVTAALGGPWAAGGGAAEEELEITSYLVNAVGGLRQNHTVVFSCASGQGEIEAEAKLLLTIQSIAMV